VAGGHVLRVWRAHHALFDRARAYGRAVAAGRGGAVSIKLDQLSSLAGEAEACRLMALNDALRPVVPPS
jgi:hypothetical protein